MKSARARTRCGWLLLPWMRGDGNAVTLELLGQPVGAMLGPSEHQRLVDLPRSDQLAQQLPLALAVDRVDDLLNELRRGVPLGDLDLGGAVENPIGQASDVVREGGREQQVLSIRRQALQDPADVADEAHVEHAIRLVQDEDLDATQVDGALTDVVEQPTRRRDHDLRALRGARAPGG